MLNKIGATVALDLSGAQEARPGNNIVQEHHVKAIRQFEVTAFLMSTDSVCYAGLHQDLKNKFLKDQDNYHKNLNQVYSLIVI